MDVRLRSVPYAELLGIRLVEVAPERVVATLPVRHDHTNSAGNMHGGAIMGVADHLGGVATIAGLREGQRTVTVESKTNFFAGVPEGDEVTAVCTPVHRGRTTVVVQTDLFRRDGRLAARVVQTQLVMAAPGDRRDTGSASG